MVSNHLPNWKKQNKTKIRPLQNCKQPPSIKLPIMPKIPSEHRLIKSKNFADKSRSEGPAYRQSPSSYRTGQSRQQNSWSEHWKRAGYSHPNANLRSSWPAIWVRKRCRISKRRRISPRRATTEASAEKRGIWSGTGKQMTKSEGRKKQEKDDAHGRVQRTQLYTWFGWSVLAHQGVGWLGGIVGVRAQKEDAKVP